MVLQTFIGTGQKEYVELGHCPESCMFFFSTWDHHEGPSFCDWWSFNGGVFCSCHSEACHEVIVIIILIGLCPECFPSLVWIYWQSVWLYVHFCQEVLTTYKGPDCSFLLESPQLFSAFVGEGWGSSEIDGDVRPQEVSAYRPQVLSHYHKKTKPVILNQQGQPFRPFSSRSFGSGVS